MKPPCDKTIFLCGLMGCVCAPGFSWYFLLTRLDALITSQANHDLLNSLYCVPIKQRLDKHY